MSSLEMHLFNLFKSLFLLYAWVDWSIGWDLKTSRVGNCANLRKLQKVGSSEHLEGKCIPKKPVNFPTISGSPIFMWGNGSIHGYSYPQSGWKGILFPTHSLVWIFSAKLLCFGHTQWCSWSTTKPPFICLRLARRDCRNLFFVPLSSPWKEGQTCRKKKLDTRRKILRVCLWSILFVVYFLHHIPHPWCWLLLAQCCNSISVWSTSNLHILTNNANKQCIPHKPGSSYMKYLGLVYVISEKWQGTNLTHLEDPGVISSQYIPMKTWPFPFPSPWMIRDVRGVS